MTVLSDKDIDHIIEEGDLKVERNGELAIEPASMDLHLGDEILLPKVPKEDTWPVDVTDEETYPEYFDSHGNEIPQKGFALATTEEQVNLPPDLVGVIHGRSSVGRLGLFVHNAGFIDPGFNGQVTLELFNAAPYPISLEPGMRICQLALHELKTKPNVEYSEENGNKYNGQQGPTPSRLHEDF